MSESNGPTAGRIVWRDLTVANAEEVRQFYSDVIGWESEPHNMGDYSDYDIRVPETGETVTGICHARGTNANIPPQWLIYISVDNVEECAERCRRHGGEVVDGPRSTGDGKFCVIRDPAGAVAALIGK